MTTQEHDDAGADAELDALSGDYRHALKPL